MTLEELGRVLKAKAEEIGLEYWEAKPELPYRGDVYLFTFEWTSYNSRCNTTAKHFQLLAVLAEIGITRDMLSHVSLDSRRATPWPSFFCGIKEDTMCKLLALEIPRA